MAELDFGGAIVIIISVIYIFFGSFYVFYKLQKWLKRGPYASQPSGGKE